MKASAPEFWLGVHASLIKTAIDGFTRDGARIFLIPK